MRHFFVALLSVITLGAFGQQYDSRTFFEGETLNGLIVEGAFEVKLSQGEKTGVYITAKSKVFEKLNITKSDNGIVNISDAKGVGQFLKSNKTLIKVVVSSLDILTIGGAADVLGSGEFTAQTNSTIDISGNAFMEFVKISAPAVNLIAGGNGTARVAGLTINTDQCNITTGGGADVTILGECKNLIANTNGASVLNTLMFGADNIEATLMGMSLIKAIVNKTAKVNVGGTATFKYTGAGVVEGKATRL